MTLCDEREQNIFERDWLTGGSIDDALNDVGAFISISPSQLLVETVSPSEAVAVFPNAVDPALVVTVELGEGGWGTTFMEGCPEFVVTVQELNLGAQ